MSVRSAGIFIGLILFICMNHISFGEDRYPRIKAVKGFLYYNESKSGQKSAGTLSENIIDNSNFQLWNVIIGEGSAKGYSQNTF
ncbi:MAG TPA: hypothetical protein VF857_04090, partial [Spirochaetota bacterium]